MLLLLEDKKIYLQSNGGGHASETSKGLMGDNIIEPFKGLEAKSFKGDTSKQVSD